MWPGRTDRAFRYADLVAAGATLEIGSDAPVSPLDPWHGIAAAVARTDGQRDPWHPEQSIGLDAALAAAARGRRAVRVGDVADLVLVDVDPAELTAAELCEMPVHATLVAGRWAYRGD
jgi:predicted amidohydrolase YtcJ